MSKKQLTPEEIAELEKNPAVAWATENRLFFTQEFKDWFYEEYQSGKSALVILMETGIDPKMIGYSRVNSIRWHILKEKRDDTKEKSDLPRGSRTPSNYRALVASRRISHLEQQLAYTKQELEFVKKIIHADREVQQEWESKRRRRSNSKSSKK